MAIRLDEDFMTLAVVDNRVIATARFSKDAGADGNGRGSSPRIHFGCSTAIRRSRRGPSPKGALRASATTRS